MNIYIDLFIKFIFGLSIGSFINVITYRLPLKLSILHPRSFCPKCKTSISVINNIPLISWLKLRGKCSQCNKRIPFKYFLIELSFAILFVTCTYSYPQLNNFYILLLYLYTAIFLVILVSISIIDLEYLKIPSSLTFSGIFFGILFSISNSLLYDSDEAGNIIINHFCSTILGFIIFESIGFIGKKLFKKAALGKGDSLLAALLGSWLGFQGLLLSSLLSFYYAGIFVCIGIAVKKVKLGMLIPFGPFMAVAGISLWLMGNDFWNNIIFYRIN